MQPRAPPTKKPTKKIPPLSLIECSSILKLFSYLPQLSFYFAGTGQTRLIDAIPRAIAVVD
jgi:hypothetical protein